MNWKFWKNESAVVRRLTACVNEAEERWRREHERCEELDAMHYRALGALEEESKAREKAERELAKMKSRVKLMKVADPVSEGALLDRFAGAQDNPLFLGVCQVVDQCYEALVREARIGKNTEKETNMMLGGQEALDVLKNNLIHYAATAAAREQPVEEKAG